MLCTQLRYVAAGTTKARLQCTDLQQLTTQLTTQHEHGTQAQAGMGGVEPVYTVYVAASAIVTA